MIAGAARPWPSTPALLLLVCLAVIAAPGRAGGQVTVSLKPAAQQAASALPCRLAELTIDNSRGSELFQAVRLHEHGGGPTIVYDVSAAPGTRQTLAVALPAWSQQQRYAVDLLADDRIDSPAAAELSAPIVWPLETINPDTWIAPALYDTWREEPTTWPKDLVRNVFLAAVLAAIALAAMLFVRPSAARVAAVVVVLAAAGAGFWLILKDTPLVTERRSGDGSILVVSARRTTTWTSNQTYWPVYFSPRWMQGDTLVVQPGKGVRLDVQPGRIRLLRSPGPPGGTAMEADRGTAPAGT